MFCGSLGCQHETKGDGVCVGVRDGAGDVYLTLLTIRKLGGFVKCFSITISTYLKCMKVKIGNDTPYSAG